MCLINEHTVFQYCFTAANPCNIIPRQMQCDRTPTTPNSANPFHPVCITSNQQQWSFGRHCSRHEWIPLQWVLVYLAALSLSGPSVETQHHNRMMADQGNTVGPEAALCCYFVLASSILRQFSGVWSRLWMIDEIWLREQNELLTIFSGAKHTMILWWNETVFN